MKKISGITISQLRSVDVNPQTVERLELLYGELVTHGKPRAAPTAQWFRKLFDESSAVCLAAREDVTGEIVGMAILIELPSYGGFMSGYLQDLVVLRDYGHRGIGTALMESVNAVAFCRNMEEIHWTCRPTRNAHPLYKKVGAKVRETVPYSMRVIDPGLWSV